MKRKFKGYTLVELVMVVSLLAIVLTAGTSIFYRSFQSSGVSDIQTTLGNSLRSLDRMFERTLRFGKVVRVGDNYRENCLSAEEDGVSGNTLGVLDLSGGNVLYSFANGEVSSNSAVISNPDITVTELVFTWYCKSGINDKMKLHIKANLTGLAGEAVSFEINKVINLLNSGTN